MLKKKWEIDRKKKFIPGVKEGGMAIDGEDESKPNDQDQPKKTLKRKRATLTPKQQQQLLNIRGEVVNRKEPRLRN